LNRLTCHQLTRWLAEQRIGAFLGDVDANRHDMLADVLTQFKIWARAKDRMQRDSIFLVGRNREDQPVIFLLDYAATVYQFFCLFSSGVHRTISVDVRTPKADNDVATPYGFGCAANRP
jgi:hypothetical protein